MPPAGHMGARVQPCRNGLLRTDSWVKLWEAGTGQEPQSCVDTRVTESLAGLCSVILSQILPNPWGGDFRQHSPQGVV